MKVKVYVNWDERKIISEKEYEEKVEKSAKEYAESYADFADWLNDHYHADDVWEMSESTRKEVKQEYCEACQTWAEDEVNDYWKPYEIEA